MSKIDVVRHELLTATDEVIEDAVKYIDPMVMRGLLYQLTGDSELESMGLKMVTVGFLESAAPATEAEEALVRRKAAEFLKKYRDAGAGTIDIGPRDRLHASMNLTVGDDIPAEDLGLYQEEMALNPWARSLEWRETPDPKCLEGFSVTIIGAGMGGLNAALQLKRAGIPFTVIEKNDGVGGTWWENCYPGARVDTPSRSYTHIFGVDFGYPNPFCEASENVKYFNWVADNFEVRKNIAFNTEVRSLTWNEADGMWEIVTVGPDGERTLRSNAVITAVGFLNRPNIPEYPGASEFQGQSWHTARWPDGVDLHDKRVAVVGTGATGYQMIPDLALQAKHVTVFQRTPQWLFSIPGYRSPFPPQIGWLDRNMPYYTNFMRFRNTYGPAFSKITDIDPNFDDPHAVSPGNKLVRDKCVEFLQSKISDPNLLATMTPEHPVWSARLIMVDPEYSVLDAIQRDNVTLVTDGIKRLNRTGIEAADGSQHNVDVIVYATGFHATEYLFPMEIVGRNGKKINELWEKDGARSYRGCMMPGFPNLWSLYGPNTNGALNVASFHEMVMVYALQCMERIILDGKRTVEVKEEPYWEYNRLIDDRNNKKVWADPRARNYYWTQHGRSAVQNPLNSNEMWHLLRKPDFDHIEIA